jgi:hypothetical protein
MGGGGGGELWFVFRSEISFFLSRKARIFFPEFNTRLYDKNSESDYFFSSTKIRIFFQQNWESEYLKKKTKHNPSLEVKWSVPLCYLSFDLWIIHNYTRLISPNSSYKKKYKQRWSTKPSISTKRKTTSNNRTVNKDTWNWKYRSWFRTCTNMRLG